VRCLEGHAKHRLEHCAGCVASSIVVPFGMLPLRLNVGMLPLSLNDVDVSRSMCRVQCVLGCCAVAICSTPRLSAPVSVRKILTLFQRQPCWQSLQVMGSPPR
jgi:hypothetical protein